MKLMHGNNISWFYLTNKSDITELLSILNDKSTLALDTETYPLSHLSPNASALDPHTSKIRLVQLNYIGNKIPYIVDVLKIGVEEVRELIKEIGKETVLKVIHNARFDIKQIRRIYLLSDFMIA